ncbi:hypothetical protein ACFVAV_21990 [Nocardia sp. NPDC057663]|uniref:hypothetical protein n=1 Tax=Nocardia sp. NPDC057663 TaxID=3346201 RepID=UPI00366A5A1F
MKLFAAAFLVALVGLIATDFSVTVGVVLLVLAAGLLAAGVLRYRVENRAVRTVRQFRRIHDGGGPGRRGIDDADSLSDVVDQGGYSGGGDGGGGGGD